MTAKTKAIPIVFPIATLSTLHPSQNGNLEERTHSSASRSLSALSCSPRESSFSIFSGEWSPTSDPLHTEAYRHFRSPSQPPSEIKPKKELCASVTHQISSLAAFGDKLFSGSHDNLVKTWDLASESCIQTFEEHEDSIYALAADEENLYSGSDDKTIIVRNAATGAYKTTLRGHTDGIRALLVVKRTLFSSSCDGTIRAWDLDMFTCTRVFENEKSKKSKSDQEYYTDCELPDDDTFFYSLAVKDQVLCSGSNKGSIVFWDLETGRILRTLQGPIEPVLSLLILGDRLFSAYSDSTIKNWDLTTYGFKSSLRDDSEVIHCLAADDAYLYSGGSNGLITAWDLKTDRRAAIFRGHRDAVHSLQIAAGQLYSASADGTINAWPLTKNAH